jgi:hypothetical protein
MRLPASQEITRNIQNFPKDFEPSFRASCPRFQHTGEFTEGSHGKAGQNDYYEDHYRDRVLADPSRPGFTARVVSAMRG